VFALLVAAAAAAAAAAATTTATPTFCIKKTVFDCCHQGDGNL
jgi:hypothetical protein